MVGWWGGGVVGWWGGGVVEGPVSPAAAVVAASAVATVLPIGREYLSTKHCHWYCGGSLSPSPRRRFYDGHFWFSHWFKPVRAGPAAGMPSIKRKQGAESVKSSEYEEVPLEGGGFKRRRVGAKHWQRYCEHGTRKQSCKECGGSSICEHGR